MKRALLAMVAMVATATMLRPQPVRLIDAMSSTLRAENLAVSGSASVGGVLSASMLNSPSVQSGDLAANAILSNWSPTGIATTGVLFVRASDNSGTTITGIDSTGINVGDVRTICNTNSKNDDGVIVLKNLDPSSLAANQIMTPDAGDRATPIVADYMIGPTECRDLQYANPDHTDLTFHAWIVKSAARRFSSVTTQELQLYSPIFPVAITGTNTDYAPVDAAPYVCSPGSVACSEAGNNGTWQSNSVVFLQTTTGAGATINSMVYTAGQADTLGPIKIIYNLGPGPITFPNQAGVGTANGKFSFGTGGNLDDVVLGVGEAPLVLYHRKDVGGWLPLERRGYNFDERDATFAKGVALTGGGANGHADTALLVPAGANSGVYMGYGGTIPFIYMNAVDAATNGPFAVGTTLTVSGGAFTGTTHQEICSGVVPTSASHGTIAADSTNCVGQITGIGAFTSTTLTFGSSGFGTTSHCQTTVEGATAAVITVSTVSATAPVFSCFDMSGVALNCPNFNYQCWGH